jgi:MoaA/NifB/PqqE/SkfB family radical SAM enzyme
MFNVDFEATNRCNADCYFCPRDQTPHEGLMTQETFERALVRTVELRDQMARTRLEDPSVDISICGLGEPLVNPRTPAYVAAVKDAGFPCTMSSNGAILDERRGQAVLEAGLDIAMLNVGAVGEEYEQVYKLPWERTRDNVVRFVEMAEGRCEVGIVLVDFRQDAARLDELEKYWRDQGVSTFFRYDIMNRGGSLFVDHMQFEALPELHEARELLARNGGRAICAAPFVYVFIGYDGKYYLCCSDWKKEVSFGSVHERGIMDVARGKLEHVLTRGTVCRTCNIDPLNHLTDEMQAARRNGDTTFDAAAAAREKAEAGLRFEEMLEQMAPGVTDGLHMSGRRRRRLIPLVGD